MWSGGEWWFSHFFLFIIGALVDPGTDEYKLLRALEDYRVNVTKIFLTHAHKGHVQCIRELFNDLGDFTIYLHEADRPLFDANVTKELSGDEVCSADG